jgi:hypothetical protein
MDWMSLSWARCTMAGAWERSAPASRCAPPRRRSILIIPITIGRVEALFGDALALFAGQGEVLVWGQGAWFALMSAKEIFRAMINQWFRVVDRQRQRVLGREAERAVARALLRDHREEMPEDFRALVRIFEEIKGRG